MKKQITGKLVFILLFMMCNMAVMPADAQIIIPQLTAQGYQFKHTYTQDFNTLPFTGSSNWANNGSALPGWYAVQEDGIQQTQIVASDGSAGAVALYSFGNESSADRALGGAGTSGWGGYYYAARFKNSSGETIKHIRVSFAIEQWYWTKTASSPFSFAYKKGLSVTNPTDPAGWVAVNTLAGSIKAVTANASAKPLDGNAAANRVQLQDIVLQVNLVPGEELMLRWHQQDAVYESNNKNDFPAIALDDVQVEFIQNDVFYALGKVVNHLSNWTTDGTNTGRTPTNFTDQDQTFVVARAGEYKLNRNLTITGLNSKLILGQSAQAVTLAVPNRYSLKASVDIADGSTLIVNHASEAPAFGALAETSTVIYTDSSAAPIRGNYGNLYVTGGKQKVIDRDVQVRGKLRLDDTGIFVQNGELAIADGASIEPVGEASFIKTNSGGSIKQYVQPGASRFFPVGSETGYAPVKLELPAGKQARYISVNVTDGVYVRYDENQKGIGEPVKRELVNKVWKITQDAVTPDASAVFYWSAADELPDFDRAQAEVAYYNSANTAWEPAGTPVNTLGPRVAAATPSNSLTQANVKSGKYTVWQPPRGPLPVELTTFTARYKNGLTTLNWSTSSERSSNYFSVEVSADGKVFSETGQVKAAGFSSVVRNYSFIHQPEFNGIVYYRLVEYSHGGERAYSKAVSINAKLNNAAGIKVYPNPGHGKLYLASAAITGQASLELRSMTGKIILTKKVELTAAEPAEVDMHQLPEGVYLLQINSDAGRQVVRVVHLAE